MNRSKLVRIGIGTFLFVVALMIMRGSVLDWTIIPPGYTGIKVNRLVNRGISKEDIVTGFVFFNPIQSSVIIYPTFVQRVVWTHNLQEGNPLNEELTFNTRDSVPVNLDVAVSYMLDAEKVPEFYTKFRADRIESFTHGYLRDTARNAVVMIGSEYTFDEINGNKKEEFLNRLAKELDARVNPIGVGIQQFGLIGALRPPPALADAVNAKTKAIQDSLKVENELRSTQAEAKKKIALAEGEAAANRALSSSIDDRLLAWEKIKLQREWISKWNGQTPSVTSGENTGMILSVPAPNRK